jgi:hypothetical protein
MNRENIKPVSPETARTIFQTYLGTYAKDLRPGRYVLIHPTRQPGQRR